MDSQSRRNVLLITVDQWRGDCLGVVGHPIVRTPNLDRLAAEGMVFRRHYAQAAPCGPSRASLHTGQYLMKHRSPLNGSPLDARFTNMALEARAGGYDPVLFGYTDASPDPRELDANDPRLRSYEGVLPGYRAIVDLPEHATAWGVWLREQGYDVPADVTRMYEPISDAPGAPVAYAAEHTEAAFLTGEVLDYLDQVDDEWFVHVAYIRPHPPFVAPEPYASMYDPALMPDPIRHDSYSEEGDAHIVLGGALAIPGIRFGDDLDAVRQLRATYFGMMSEVDAQVGRLLDGIRARAEWDDTLVILTSDHGEQLGDHWLTEKLGWFDQSYHIPLIIHDPRAPHTHGTVVDDVFTENVDLMPTALEWLDLPVPIQCDGRSLLPFLRGERPDQWRDGAFWEWEFRDPIGKTVEALLEIDMDQCALSVLRDEHGKYVHFTRLPPLFYDLDRDPDELRDRAADPEYAATVLGYAQRMLSLRMEHVDQTLTGLVVTPMGVLDGRA